MKTIVMALSLMLIGISSFASDALKCDVKLLKQSKVIPILVKPNESMEPMDLGQGRTLEIDSSVDDVQFTELRPPTVQEKEEFDLKNGRAAMGLRGKTVAYAHTTFTGTLKDATFSTEDVWVYCELE